MRQRQEMCIGTALAGLLLLLPLAAGGQEETRSSGQERVVVYGERPAEARSGVIALRVEDGQGRFVPGLPAEAFRLNGGRVRIEAVAEVRQRPALLLLYDETMEKEERARAMEILVALAERFPEGVSALSFLTNEGVEEGRFVVERRRRTWLSNEDLPEVVRRKGESLFPSSSRAAALEERKHLVESLAWLTRRFDRGMSHANVLLVLTDGYLGDPRGRYEPACVPNAECVLHPTPEVGKAKVRLETALAKDRVTPIALLGGTPRELLVDLWGQPSKDELGHPDMHEILEGNRSSLGSGDSSRPRENYMRKEGRLREAWKASTTDVGELLRDAVLRDRRQLESVVEEFEGEVFDLREDESDELARRVAAKVESRLRWYWIAWKTPDEERRGEKFLRIEVEAPGRARPVPDRIGPDQLLGRDPYLVLHFGALDEMPWDLRANLWPAEALRIVMAATELRESLGLEWISDVSCPFTAVVAQQDRKATVKAVTRALQAVQVPAEREQVAGALQESTLLDLCAQVRAAR